jgi:cytoskeleton protein RodZ
MVSGTWWWFSHEPAPETAAVEPAVLAPFVESATEAPSEAVLESAAEAATDTPTSEEPAMASEEVPAPVSLEDQPEALGVPDVSAIPAADLLQLDLTFTGDCWTEVTDADGQRLYFELGVAGSSASISGAAPFRVLLGNSANVSLLVDGNVYAIPASQRRGNTARLTLSKP